MSQALINVLKNAAEAVHSRDARPRLVGRLDWRQSCASRRRRIDSLHRRRRRQRSRPAAGEPRPPDRTLRHHPGEGHRASVSPSSRKSWKITMETCCSRIGKAAGLESSLVFSEALTQSAGSDRRSRPLLAMKRGRPSPPGCTSMASGSQSKSEDILIVDDEADIRVAGRRHPRGRRLRGARGRRQRRRVRRRRAAVGRV